MPVSAASLTDEELTAFVKARLLVSGFDLSLLPTTFDAATGVPTQDSLVASLKGFVRSTPGAINTWRPASGSPTDDDLYAQQVAPPLEYPSIVEAWTGKVDA
ncbi:MULTISPECIES: hypothetical protein [unclassified Nocardioides]|uniref:hypothetical protein n=1 Tax=unclassified Nocardioides TaxID=2615069 RepID=UPI0007038B60|nr:MULTISPECIES: hypothetical protein [unclassified Nocardioides]KQP64878.1 hypothetical protein ASF47_13490 [Nocardioides sp. Leaf285]MBJ7529920.1 hypothetical protein [Nocardioides sp.]